MPRLPGVSRPGPFPCGGPVKTAQAGGRGSLDPGALDPAAPPPSGPRREPLGGLGGLRGPARRQTHSRYPWARAGPGQNEDQKRRPSCRRGPQPGMEGSARPAADGPTWRPVAQEERGVHPTRGAPGTGHAEQTPDWASGAGCMAGAAGGGAAGRWARVSFSGEWACPCVRVVVAHNPVNRVFVGWVSRCVSYISVKQLF